MNERIKELEKQSVSYNEDEEIWEFDREKFAELLIQEFINVINKIDSDDAGEYVGLYKAEVAVMKHFGIEE